MFNGPSSSQLYTLNTHTCRDIPTSKNIYHDNTMNNNKLKTEKTDVPTLPNNRPQETIIKKLKNGIKMKTKYIIRQDDC